MEIFYIYFIILLFSSTLALESIYQMEEIEANKDKTIILDGTELYISTIINSTGYLGHRIIVPESFSFSKNSIYYASLNSTDLLDDTEFIEVYSMSETIDKNIKKLDIGPFIVEKNKYAIIKLVGLKHGEKMTVEAYYISKGFTIGFIIIISIAIILIIILIIWFAKKCCLKKKKNN